MTEKQFRKETYALLKQIHDPESQNQLYHTARRLLQKEAPYEQPGSQGVFFPWNRLLEEGSD